VVRSLDGISHTGEWEKAPAWGEIKQEDYAKKSMTFRKEEESQFQYDERRNFKGILRSGRRGDPQEKRKYHTKGKSA